MQNAPVPEEVLELLTENQLITLRRVENFGWQLKFVRRPRFEPPVVVLENASGLTLGLLDASGKLTFEPCIEMRA